MPKLTKTQLGNMSDRQLAAEFKRQYGNSVQSFKNAALLYVQLLNYYPKKAVALKDGIPQIHPDIWRRLELVGRGDLLPEIGLSTMQRSRICRRLSLADQRRLVYQGVRVVVAGGETVQTLKLRAMTHAQVKQVVDGPNIRSVAGQRKYLLANQKKEEAKRLEASRDMAVATRIWIESGRFKSDGPIDLPVEQVMKLLEPVGA